MSAAGTGPGRSSAQEAATPVTAATPQAAGAPGTTGRQAPADADGPRGVAVLVLDGDPQEVEATTTSARVVSSPADELHVCTTWGQGARLAQAPYALLLRAGDRLEPGSLRALEGFARARSAQVVTADRIEQGSIRRCPRFSLRLLEQLPYAGRALLVSTGLLREVTGSGQEPSSARAESATAPQLGADTEWDLQLRLVGAAGVVEHCPVVAVNQAGPVQAGALADRLATVRRHLERQGRSGEAVRPGPTGLPRVLPRTPRDHRVSVVVPTAFTRRDLAGAGPRVLVEVLVAALAQTVEGVDCEIVLVVDEAAPEAAIESCRALWRGPLRVARTRGGFNFSRAINAGVAEAGGDVVLLLNDDVEPVRPGWIQDMLATLDLPGVGAVGARLLFDDGGIQHLGVVCPPSILPTHPRLHEPDDPAEPMAQADVDYLAVTGACLMYRRADHEAVGGWDEELPLNFNDTDFCLRLASRGASIVCVNSVRLIHRESSTRQARTLDSEAARLAPWAGLMAADPHIEYWG
ncbi:glycosyltransferase family 2 protein [Actinomyces bowdenii]|uniref:Glycosyltransferase n=1 Tax=Actinomyces bowdenii TaxID=131109 RepID=A0A3P1UPF8_9ACTO|nr:glycosyltransferase [Actinomyces bowdenii]RRD23662.1 glycosyltransferase [Actinomyces bowdenii]